MANGKPTFTCYNCRRESDYSQRAEGKVVVEFVRNVVGSAEDSETRTYLCQHCHTENQITKTEAEWDTIDVIYGG